jgi:hypothetical protein
MNRVLVHHGHAFWKNEREPERERGKEFRGIDGLPSVTRHERSFPVVPV